MSIEKQSLKNRYMKKTGLIAVMCVAALSAAAQEKADIIASYDVKVRNWDADTVTTTRMSLPANTRQAKYFNDLSLWSDSLSSTPEGKKQLQQIIMAACMTETPEGVTFDMRKGPVKNVHTYVFTSQPDDKLTYYSKFGDSEAYYEEALDEMQWEIGDETSTVLGYECQSATADYHGRKWTAWFAPEIPVAFGPWKFHGLPGLILKAEADGTFCFEATGIEKSDRLMTPIYSPEKYQKTSRKKALADDEYFMNNREAIIQAKFGGSVKFENVDPDRPKYNALRDSLEPDYKDK